MKHLVVFLSAILILFLYSCNSENPTSANSYDAPRHIASVNVSGDDSKVITEYLSHLTHIEWLSDASILFSTDRQIIIQSLINPSDNFVIETVDLFEGVRAYENGMLIIFSENRDIFRLENMSGIKTNITNTPDTFETYPIYLKNENAIIFQQCGGDVNQNASLVKLDIETGAKTVIIEGKAGYIIPLYVIDNDNRLIFFETSIGSSFEGYFKSVSLSDYGEIVLLGRADLYGALSSSISGDNKIVHTLGGQIILFNINNLTERVVSNQGRNAFISADGKSIVSALTWGINLSDGNGEITKNLLDANNSEQNYHRVIMSPNKNKVIYVESESPDFY